jgi:hypothetical protein
MAKKLLPSFLKKIKFLSPVQYVGPMVFGKMPFITRISGDMAGQLPSLEISICLEAGDITTPLA